MELLRLPLADGNNAESLLGRVSLVIPDSDQVLTFTLIPLPVFYQERK